MFGQSIDKKEEEGQNFSRDSKTGKRASCFVHSFSCRQLFLINGMSLIVERVVSPNEMKEEVDYLRLGKTRNQTCKSTRRQGSKEGRTRIWFRLLFIIKYGRLLW